MYVVYRDREGGKGMNSIDLCYITYRSSVCHYIDAGELQFALNQDAFVEERVVLTRSCHKVECFVLGLIALTRLSEPNGHYSHNILYCNHRTLERGAQHCHKVP